MSFPLAQLQRERAAHSCLAELASAMPVVVKEPDLESQVLAERPRTRTTFSASMTASVLTDVSHRYG